MNDKELEEMIDEVMCEEKENYPEAYQALGHANKNKRPLYFKVEGKIICVRFNDIDTIFDKDYQYNNDYVWDKDVRLHKGKVRLLIELVNFSDYEKLMKTAPVINYFPEVYLLEDYGKTWSDKEEF